MIQLLVKEVRQLRPIAYLWFFLLVFGYGIQFFTERLDENTFGQWCEGYCDYGSNVAVASFIVLLAMVTAYSLFPREYDESTIDLLRALPISRSHIFIAKVLAGWLVLIALHVVSYSLDAALLASNPESIGGRFYSQVWFTLLWRDCVFVFIVLSHGVLLSWFRTLGLILYFIYLLLLVLAETYLGTSGDWNIFTLLSNEYFGSELQVNSRALWLHTGVAFLILLVAYRLWNRTDSGGATRPKATRSFRLLQIVSGVLGFFVLAALMAYQVQRSTGSTEASDLQVVATDHYRFVYRTSKTQVVNYMLGHAEADLAKLADLMGVQEIPKIRVDLSASSEHAAGLAKWKKIQIDLDAFFEDISQRRVLVHEAAHVLQSIESNRALASNYPAVKFYIEGMAQYLSFAIVPEVSRRESNWRLAAVSWKRQNIQFSDMINSTAFAQKFDAELHYSLGDIWVSVLAESCGKEAVGNFVRATGREGAPRDLIASVFWRDTMQAIGCDLDTVNADWRKKMNVLFNQTTLSQFPIFKEISVSQSGSSDYVKVTARLDAIESRDELPSTFVMRVSNATATLSAGPDRNLRGKLIDIAGEPMVEYLLPVRFVPNTRFRYQLGYAPTEDSRYYYGAWRRGTLPASSGGP